MQVVRIKLGRKRRNGKRKPSGDLILDKLSREIVAAGMPHRSKLPKELQTDEKAESSLGRMRLRGQITELQFTAGERWRGVVGSYLATIGPPRALAGRGYGQEMDDEEAERRKRECFEGIEAIKVAGADAIKAINRVVLEDCDCPWMWKTPLIWGLVELVKHFGLARSGQGGKIRSFQTIDSTEQIT